jgi:hypothetical protein
VDNQADDQTLGRVPVVPAQAGTQSDRGYRLSPT